MDQFFTVEVLSQTPNPQQVIYAAMHQDYAEGFVWAERDRFPDEAKAGDLVVRNLLAGNRGHYGPLEHPQIVLNCGFFPHSTMQQIRTHRVGISFDVQCLAGETEVTFLRSSGQLLKIKMADLADLWRNGEKTIGDRKIRGRQGEPGQARRDGKTRLKQMKLRVLNESTGFFEIGHVQEVFDQGTQPVYRLTLEDGRTLDCTENHRLLTQTGWQRMKQALGLIIDSNREVISYHPDCHLMTNGVAVGEALYPDKVWLAEQLAAGLADWQIAQAAACPVEAVKQWVDRHGLTLNKAQLGTPNLGNRGLQQVYRLKLTDDQRQKRRERSQRLTCWREASPAWKGGMTKESSLTQKVIPAQTWTEQPNPPGYQLKAHPMRVVQVRYLGLQPTYDLQVAGDWHNFVANGIVVHNSFRYTGSRITDVVAGKRDLEEVFYLRPLGAYTDRQGKRYEYTEAIRQQDLDWCLAACQRYQERINQGFSEEHARGIIPFDVRQHWVMSANVRSLMHLLDLRWKLDAQLEAQQLCELIWNSFEAWVPAIAEWYESNRAKKARLAP
ncbi:MAG TPA: FAD-dependent thymidylate synthase [Coleofasciculaceae cyanobacterium]